MDQTWISRSLINPAVQDAIDLNRIEARADDLFRNGKGIHTDCLIKCGEGCWKAHKAILASRCRFFRVCFELGFSEADTGTVVLEEDDPVACGVFLEFLYTRDLSLCQRFMCEVRPECGKDPGCCGLYAHTRITPELLMGLCEMAHKYEVPALTYSLISILTSPWGLRLCKRYEPIDVWIKVLNCLEDLLDRDDMQHLYEVIIKLVNGPLLDRKISQDSLDLLMDNSSLSLDLFLAMRATHAVDGRGDGHAAPQQYGDSTRGPRTSSFWVPF